MVTEDVVNRFTFHPADSADRALAHETLRALFLTLARDLNERLPEGREKAVAITKLEEAMFWSNAAVARS